jgi:hypothetical protein
MSKGYWMLHVDGGMYYAHRLAWLYVYGAWPSAQIDHINRQRGDNRIANLREVTNRQNHQNRAICKRNTSGLMGVSKLPSGMWRAQLYLDGKGYFLGNHETKELAYAAYVAGKRKLHEYWNGPAAGEDLELVHVSRIPTRLERSGVVVSTSVGERAPGVLLEAAGVAGGANAKEAR